MSVKKVFKIKDKIMFKRRNCDQKSKLSEMLTEPLNLRDTATKDYEPLYSNQGL